jgi:hypothetical protein
MQQPCAHRHAGYAVIVIPLGWWPWNVLLLALLFRAHRKRVVNERAPRLLNRDLKTVLGGKAIVSDGEAWLSRQVPKLSVITFADADAVRAR